MTEPDQVAREHDREDCQCRQREASRRRGRGSQGRRAKPDRPPADDEARRRRQRFDRPADRRAAANRCLGPAADPQQVARQARGNKPRREGQGTGQGIGDERGAHERNGHPQEDHARFAGRDCDDAADCDADRSRREQEAHGAAEESSGWGGVGRSPNVLNGQ